MIPESNVGDLREIPKELKKRLEFIPVKHMREALQHVLVTPIEMAPSQEASRTASPPQDGPSPVVHAAPRQSRD